MKMPSRIAGRLILLPLLGVLLSGLMGFQSPAWGRGPKTELRGVWLTNVDSDVLTSPAKISEAMDFLASINVNVVYPVVWNKSLTLYPSEVMEKRFGVRIDPLYGDRDPLQEVIIEAHRRGIEVIPWFEYGFASSYNLNGGPILEANPQWAAIGPDGGLVRKNGFEWLNAFDPEVQEFLTELILEVVRNYDVDGIQGDDRLPALPSLAGYDDYTKAKYRKEFGTDPPPDYKNEQWVRWRADILTNYLADLREKVTAMRPGIIISMSPSYYDWSLYEYLQDSKTWVDKGLVDTIHPQAYRYDLPAYKAIIDDLTSNQFEKEQLRLLYPGILVKVGSYRISEEDLLASIAYNRRKGIKGEVSFFYEGLRMNDDALARALVAGPYAEPAAVPYRTIKNWRPKPVIANVPKQDLKDGWQMSADGEFAVRPGGTPGRVVHEIKIGHTATYDVLALRRPAGNLSTAMSYTFVPGNDGAQALPVGGFTGSESGWVHIGRIGLPWGVTSAKLVINTWEEDPGKETQFGPLMFVLDRRSAPKMEWIEP